MTIPLWQLYMAIQHPCAFHVRRSLGGWVDMKELAAKIDRDVTFADVARAASPSTFEIQTTRYQTFVRVKL